jgi:predicted phage terminase large subunit-like protein
MELTAEIISGFSSSLLQKNYDNAVESPTCHHEWWKLCCAPYQKVAIAAPRRHAKSTAITLAYVLACVLFRQRSYVVVVSDTITQATQFLGEIKKELLENDRLKELFGFKDFEEKDTEDDVIGTFTDGKQFRVCAKGSEQKLRGLKWDHKRPDLIVGDDLENDEIVMNKERREKFKRWFYGALVPSLSANGIIRIVGTILHEDSLLNNFMPSTWDKYTVVEPLKIWSKNARASWKAVKYRAHTDNFQEILWPQMYTKDIFLHMRQDYMDRGILDVYSQEILNEPIDDSVAYFKKLDFLPMSQEDKKKNMNYYIAADLAISKEETADYSVFMVVGVDENRMIHVRDIIRERLDGREIVDTILALHKTYIPELFGIEEMQVSKSIGPFLREEMYKTGTYINLMPLKHNGRDKIARAKSIQGRMRAHAVRFDKSADWYPTLEDELCKFPRGTKDDQVDAFAYVGLMLDSLIEAPTQNELEEEDYLYELESSGLNDAGRSAVTGY